jgi:hypothetical protein
MSGKTLQSLPPCSSQYNMCGWESAYPEIYGKVAGPKKYSFYTGKKRGISSSRKTIRMANAFDNHQHSDLGHGRHGAHHRCALQPCGEMGDTIQVFQVTGTQGLYLWPHHFFAVNTAKKWSRSDAKVREYKIRCWWIIKEGPKKKNKNLRFGKLGPQMGVLWMASSTAESQVPRHPGTPCTCRKQRAS